MRKRYNINMSIEKNPREHGGGANGWEELMVPTDWTWDAEEEARPEELEPEEDAVLAEEGEIVLEEGLQAAGEDQISLEDSAWLDSERGETEHGGAELNAEDGEIGLELAETEDSGAEDGRIEPEADGEVFQELIQVGEALIPEVELQRMALRARLYGEADGDRAYYEQAQNYAKEFNVPYADFLQVLRHYNKIERFGTDDRRKFYFSTDLETAKQVMELGFLTDGICRSQDSEKVDGSLMHLSYDYIDEAGEPKTGFAKERAAESQQVTFVLDGRIMDLDGFEAGTKYPTIDMVDLKDYCLGVVVPGEESLALWYWQKRQGTGYAIYDEVGWNWKNDFAWTDELRDKAQQTAIQGERYLADVEKVLEKVDADAVREQMEQELDKIPMEVWRQIADFYEAAGVKLLPKARAELRKSATKESLEVLAKAMGLKEMPNLMFTDKMRSSKEYGYYDAQRNLIIINADLLKGDGYRALVETLAHEMRHAMQHQIVKRDPDGEGNLYRVNEEVYIRWEDDYTGYRKQLLEVEAEAFGRGAWRHLLKGSRSVGAKLELAGMRAKKWAKQKKLPFAKFGEDERKMLRGDDDGGSGDSFGSVSDDGFGDAPDSGFGGGFDGDADDVELDGDAEDGFGDDFDDREE